MESDRAIADLGEAIDVELAMDHKQQTRQPKRRFIGRKEAAERAEQTGVGGTAMEESAAVQGREQTGMFMTRTDCVISRPTQKNSSKLESGSVRDPE